jgi:transcriptional regulator with XRE-family HTH domain
MMLGMAKRKRAGGVDLLDRAKVRQLRESLGLSQSQAAEKAGMSGGKSQWSDIESGRTGGITLATLARIAAALDVPPGKLLVRDAK